MSKTVVSNLVTIFESGNRQLLSNGIVMINKPYFSQNLQFMIQSGYNKPFVATERMRLDTPDLNECWHHGFSNKLYWRIHTGFLEEIDNLN